MAKQNTHAVSCYKSGTEAKFVKVLFELHFVRIRSHSNHNNIYGAVIVAQTTARAPCSCDEYGTAPSGR